MSKQKTNKTILKRFKLTGTGKLLRRHQLGAGTHRRKKAKSALERYKKTISLYKEESKKFKKLIGV